MHVAMLTPSLSRAAGGIFEIERSLSKALHDLSDVSVDVLGLRDAHTEADLSAWRPLEPAVFETRGPDAFGYAPDLYPALRTSAADLVHLHALWMYPSVASVKWTRHTGRPHVVTINGMLDPWAVSNSGWKKQIAGWLYEDANLTEAACLQVNTKAERRAVRDYGIDTPVCVIPNGVDLPAIDEIATDGSATGAPPPWAGAIPDDRRVMLFLGRIHPKKGLRELIDGWSRWTDGEDWALAVVGWDDGGHEPQLRQHVRDAGVKDRVYFLGPQFGDDKAAAFAHADAFILPSYSEGFPMAVLEAWSYALPVLKTRACNIPDGFDAGAALEIEPDAASITEGLQRFTRLPVAEQEAIGRAGRALVEQQYTWPQVARQMRDVYRWVLEDAARPDSVVLD